MMTCKNPLLFKLQCIVVTFISRQGYAFNHLMKCGSGVEMINMLNTYCEHNPTKVRATFHIQVN